MLVEEMPCTLAALRAGETNEWRATIAVRETALLSRENRALVDARLRLSGVGDAGVARQARKLGFALEPGLAYKRAKAAQVQRRVSLRPAPDCMTILTAVLPVAEGVAVYAALTRAADAAAVDPGDGRSKGQVMADTLRERVLGSSEPVPVEVQLVIPARTLGGGDEPGHVNGFGPIPAPLARQLADPPDRDAQRWIRRLWAEPDTGQLVAMESRSRFFPEGLRRFVVARDQYCTTPWCAAPIRQIDHITPAAAGGKTCADNAQGLCQACNLAKAARA
ncbi:HNH endonuclease [Spongisporangium articulatum]|uniref:HNH endonuclease n=1 Tax=Spongisporangium articulatum TaxID=3362603 RepID=A0ABW8AN30_9ACTN